MNFNEWSNKKKKKQEEEEKAASTAPSSSKSDSGSWVSTAAKKVASTAQQAAPAKDFGFNAWSNKKHGKTRTVNDWVKESSAALDNINTFYQSYSSANDGRRQNLRDQVSNLLSEAVDFRKQFSGNKEAISAINEVVNALSDANKYSRSANAYWDQWESEDAYTSYMNSPERKWSETYGGKTYSELKDIMKDLDNTSAEYEWVKSYSRTLMTLDDYNEALKEAQQTKNRLEFQKNTGGSNQQLNKTLKELDAEIDSLKSGKWRLENEGKYADLSSRPDFEELSTDVEEKQTATFGIQFGDSWLGTGDPIYDFINNIEGIQDKQMNNPDPEERPVASMYKYAFMTDEEVASYNYLYNAEGEDAANEYLDYISYDLDARRMQQTKIDTAKQAEEYPFLMSALSVPAALVSGIGWADAKIQQIYNDAYEGITGEYAGPVNFNSWAQNPSVIKDTTRGTVAQIITDKTGTIQLDEEEHPILSQWLNGKSLGDAYNLGMSMGDSAAAALLAPVTGGSSFGSMLLAGSAATSTMLEKAANGATDEQAITSGLYAGAFEFIFEKVSLDNLLKSDTRSLTKALLQQGLVEGTEEINTSFANNVADIIIMAGKSDYKKNIAAYMALGMTEEEATKQALMDMAIEMSWDFVGGAISGGVMGAGGSVVNIVQQDYQAKQTYGEDVSSLINEALELDPNNALAQKMQARQEAGKSARGGDIYNLVQQNETAIRNLDQDTIYNATLQRLRDLGETENVRAVSVAITKQIMGEKLTRADRQVLAKSKYAQRVSNELNPDNIKSGEYSTAWAQQMDTNRINPEEYSSYVAAAENVQDETGTPEQRQASQNDQNASEATADEEILTPDQKTDSEAKYEAVQKTKSTEVQTATETVSEPEAEEESTVTLEDASKKYGAQAGAMIHTYKEGQDVGRYDAAYQVAYNMGKSGVNLDYAMNSEATSYLSEKQREFAYKAGKSAADTTASEKEAANAQNANGKTGRKKGSVKGEGVTISDLKKSFNDTQNTAYKLLSTYAEATGIDIVLFKSKLGPDGKFQGAQGRYKQSDPGTIYIDINAGLEYGKDVKYLGKYAMMRTFAHEFTHFIENWNPVQYNEFRKVVFDTLTKRGKNVHDLIEEKQALSPGMEYDAASREVVAEAMTDILPDANFVETLANEHKTIFDKLLEKLKEFVAKLKEYYRTIGPNSSREANALKEQVGEAVHYVDNIVKLFDQVAVQAVENYQKTVATEETVTETAETVETVTETKEPVSITDELGFTITDNLEHGSLEISFDGRPSETVRDVLKAKKFRWHKTKKIWYGYGERAEITEALRTAYDVEEETAAENPDMETLREMGAKPVGDNALDVTDLFFPELKKEETTAEAVQEVEEPQPEVIEEADPDDVYARVARIMSSSIRYYTDGFLFRVYKSGNLYKGHLDAATQHDGYEVANARGVHYTSQYYENRSDAVEDIVEVARNNKLLEPRVATENNIEEVTSNVEESENGSDARAVHEPVRGSEGTTRLLEGVEPEPVRGSDEGREPVQSGSDQGTGDAGRDRQPDAAGDVSERGERDRVGGDLQQLQSVTEESQETKKPDTDAVKLHEVVVDLTAQKSTTQPKGSNFVIGDSLDLPNGTKSRTRANIAAIKLVKQIAAEGRIATADEQVILSKYVGWGGLADAFGKPVSNHATRKIDYEPVEGLEAEFEELKQALTEEEYKAARESTKNAHYTSIEVIKAMYDGLKQMGFTGGRMLEPSSGVGNFVGAMPADMSSTVKSWTMVELDNITGMLAKYLYPNADVRIQGFEEANIPDGYMDVAIGNVPFGNYVIHDKHYPKTVTSAIHNYFFAKALDKVRPGGICMFITSAYTMNAKDDAVRKYIMQRADLLGAVRLPNTAFAGNAGTSVVTDILILKKREARTEYAGETFAEANWERVSETGWEGAYVNEYFTQHPEMVLGKAKLARGLYSSNELTYDPYTDRGPLGDQIREALKNIKGKMDYTAQVSPEASNFQQAKAKKKSQKLRVKDGVIQAQDENGNLTNVEVDKDTAARITGMVEIRDAHTALCDALQQGVNKKSITALRKALNKAYDTFVEKYGYLNSTKNKKAINAFADRYAILSLENYSLAENTTGKKGKKVEVVSKSDIFTKDTIAANRTAASAENVEEGLTISLNTTGKVDSSMIARLTGQKVESVTRQLIDQRLVFKDRDGNLIPAVQYLSGNVRAKLREMEGLVGIDSDYKNNVEALREIVPPTVQHTDIYVNPGANWVPVVVYEDFVSHILNRTNHENWRTGKKDFSVEYVPETNEYKVAINDAYAKQSAQNTQVWGESGKAFSTIFENMLNGRRTNVYKTDADGNRVLDKAKTEAVAEKVEKLNEEFRKWLWDDESRRNDMQELYNETYNALVTPKYSGATLTVNGLNSEYSLRDHQKDAVARIINSGGNTLLAHRVGAGKTMEMAAAAMKLKQLGVIKKPMFVVPNNVVAQWGKEFKDYFPAANILMVGDEDMTPAERMTTINKIKNNDYDAVILAYTKFEKIQMTNAWRQKFYEEQIESIMFAINAEKEAQGGKGFTVKQLEAKRKQLEAKVKKLTDKAKDEDGAMFEDLGVDALFVDEAHNFKNLEYSTRMSNVSGLGKADGSQRAFDMYTKVRYLQQLNGGRGIVFATATPVMNSMTEMYIMQKYLQPDTLKQLGIEHFDSWAKMFGEVVNALEIAPSGSGYRLKQTFSKFKNVKALQQLFRSFTDVLTDIPGLKIPKMKGGKVQIVECAPGEFQKNYMTELAKRSENVKNVDPKEDNMLKITSDGRKISYSQRMIDPSLPYEETGKIYQCCEKVYEVYKESSANKGTQMIFCDMATPKGKANDTGKSDADSDEFAAVDVESAQLYDDMKARLIQMGIPAKEIAFIHDAKNDKQKAELSEKMNAGTIRVLIGSTGKMGVGLNAQVKAVAIHHLDAPWRPGDIEQRDGRVFRQKNQNDEAYKFVYVTKGSFDSRLWDILERKQNFINQVMNGEDVGNEIEDTGEVTLSAAEVKAIASDNPLIMEQVALEKEISKLQSLQQAHRANVTRASEKMVSDRRRIVVLETRISEVQADIQSRKDTYSKDEVFSIQIGNQTYTDKKDAGAALIAAAQGKAQEGNYTTIGKFAGFDLRVVKTAEGINGVVAGTGNYDFKTYPLNPTHGINHLASVVASFDDRLNVWTKELGEVRKDLDTQKKLAAATFEQAETLKEKRTRYDEIMYILNPPSEQNVSEEGVQEQSRAYLEDGEPAPVFYNQMAKVIEGVKQERLGADSVVNMLRGKGVKAEEIKWSGIEAFLEGKKSVTKAELLEFAAGSMLQIEEEHSGNTTLVGEDGTTYESDTAFKDAAYAIADERGIDRNRVKFVIDTDDMYAYAYVGTPFNQILSADIFEMDGLTPRWGQYKLDGGSNYREIVFRMPESEYSNRAMRVHWGYDATGVLAHARVQDFDSAEGKMLFIEEIQSDWHNEGHAKGYESEEYKAAEKASDEAFDKWSKIRTAMNKYARSSEFKTDPEDVRKKKWDWYRRKEEEAYKERQRADATLELLLKEGKGIVPDAPFRDTYHEYVLKRLIRMAAEQGYDSIGWTPAQIQSERWSEEYAEGYRIEYDQEMPKFLNKYGKKWGAKVGKTRIQTKNLSLEEEVDLASTREMYTDEEFDKARGITEVWAIPITDSMKESVLYEGQPQYQQRTNTLTDREVLAMAASEVTIADLTDGERGALQIFKDRLTKLEELQEKRAEQGKLYKDQQFGANVDREAAAATLNRMHLLDDQISAANDDVFDVEEKAVLRKVLQKARKVVEQKEREHGKEILNRWRDRRNNAAAIKKYRERIRGDVDDLTNWILHPSNKDVVKHVPDALKNSVIPFLSSINFMSKQSLKGGNATVADREFMKQLNGLKAALKPNQNVDEAYANYTDLPPNFMDRLQTFIDSMQALVDNNSGTFIINQMTSEELKELSKVVRTLKEYVKNFNKFHVNAMFQHVYEAGDDTISELVQMDNAGSKTGAVSNFVFWQQIRPAYAFERFGDGGKAIYDGLRNGQATLAFNTKKIMEFSEQAYTEAEVKAWEKEIKEFDLGGDTVKMPVSTIMSLYELSKRPQAMGHINGGGIRVATFTRNGKKISDIGHTVTMMDLAKILDSLTPRQKEVADNLQKFMQEQGGKWGNYVSLKRFGEELFGEKHYFPINSDGRHLAANADEHPSAASLYALLNMGFTKELQEGANNRLVLYSIFDVFANHMASMAQYNAFALPVVDALKWFNYQQKSDPDENGKREVLASVRDQMDRVYGVPEESRPGSGRQGYAQTFIINILRAFNGTETQGIPTDQTGVAFNRQYNMAQVAYNFRVVVQQPMAITRAALLVDYRSIMKGMKLSPKAIKANIEEMNKYSGIAAWKSLGFYDVNISRGLTDMIKHDKSVRDKIGDVGMWGAEQADRLTWAGIWSACKEEVKRKQRLTPQDSGFYEAVTKLFEDVVYKTQVVDSVLTKNEFLRSKGFFARLIGSFMSEPTTTASMLIDAYDKYHADMQKGMSKQQAWKKNGRMIGRVTYVYSVGAILLAAVQAAADALRDDDDYQTFLEKWLEAFTGNFVDELMPFNKLPILSDFYEAAKEVISIFGVDTYGNPPQTVIMQWYDSLAKGVEILHDHIIGKDTDYTWYGGAYKLLQALSGMTGLPMASATREITTAWNNTVGAMAPSLKVKSYDPGEKANIKYAYQDGYLTDEEAIEQLVAQGLVKTEDEAYWLVQGWEDGTSSKYDTIYDAVRNGGDFDAAMDELTAHGHTEKDVLSNIKRQIGKWYQDGEITKQQATEMLKKYFDLDNDEITAQVNKWSSKVVTGIAFDDIKQEFLDGNITKKRAVDMYVRYGGYTKEKATDTVEGWVFEEDHGFKYSDRGEQFKEGKISAKELMDMLMTTGGKTKEEAQTSLYGYCRDGYEEGYFTRSEATRMMVQYGGLTDAEAESKLRYVDVKKQFPDTYVDDAWVEEFYTEVESSGMALATFIDYRNQVKSITGEGKKERRMAVINSLPISYEQKDALYYAEGWTASRIYEAPWH